MSAALITQLNEVITALGQVDPRELGSGLAVIQRTEDLLKATNRLDAVISTQLQVLHIDRSTEIESGRKTRGWLVEEQCRSKPEASRRMTVARAMPEHPVIADALARGEINLEHAQVILRLLRSTPPELRDVVEKALVDAAAYVDPSALAAFCRDVKQNLGWAEDKQEADQRRYDSRWLTVSDTIEGMTSISGMLDPAGAAALKAALHAMMSKGGEEDTRTSQQRRADALVSLANRALDAGELPEVNGERPHISLTLAWEDLKRDLQQQGDTLTGEFHDRYAGGAMLDGTEVSIATARMLACDAGIIPITLGGDGEILDIGRRTRTWPLAILRALLHQCGGRCGWPKCHGRAEHAHHLQYWSLGGQTSVANGVYLCGFHHRLIHHSDWTITKHPDTTITVHRDPTSTTGPPGWHP